MRKIILTLLALVSVCFVSEAKVIKITLADGTMRVFTSSQLSDISFNDDGTLSVTSYNGMPLMQNQPVLSVLSIDDEEVVYEQSDETLKLDLDVDGIPFNVAGERPVKRLKYVYPSMDPFGNPVTLSGCIIIPDEIWDGECKSEGILLYNHYTIFHRDEAPTAGYTTLESMFLANPLKLNYILVESDFYGFGATVRFPQAFLQGTNNARASLDGLLAAKRILSDMGIDYGPLCFNLGYSSGGFDALATQKLRDMEYADLISFDKTFAGGGPYDINECYRQYVIIDSTAYNAVPLLLMVSTNETQQMGLEYTDVFQPEIASQIDELINSKNYSSWPVCDIIGRDKKIHEILTSEYCDLKSPESKEISSIFKELSIATDWTPDPSQRIYIFHSRTDDYVPVQSARGIIKYLQKNGFEPSIIPGKTNLQTNYVVTGMGHLSATLVYLIQTTSALKAWPVMYTDGVLNPDYAELINCDFDLIMAMRQLDALGFDCRGFIKAMITLMDSSVDVENIDKQTLKRLVIQACEQIGITLDDLKQMFLDSGIEYQPFVMELIAYLAEQPSVTEGADLQMAVDQIFNEMMNQSLTPADVYANQLREWIGK